MRLHADFDARVVIDTTAADWVPSPQPGVDRKLLDRIGAEIARATSLVRYAPGSHFEAHTHGLGEEFLVLSGTFADESGDYPAGTYVRNPPGSHHRPRSDEGCEIFVKLRQFDPEDLTRVVIRPHESLWHPGRAAGHDVLPLHAFRTECVTLERWAPGIRGPELMHPGGVEILVLDGVLGDEHGTYAAGTWLRSPPATRHAPFSDTGCRIWVKTGHLPPPA